MNKIEIYLSDEQHSEFIRIASAIGYDPATLLMIIIDGNITLFKNCSIEQIQNILKQAATLKPLLDNAKHQSN